VQELHDLANDLLLGPAGGNPLGAFGTDAGHLVQLARFLGNDLEHCLLEGANELFSVYGGADIGTRAKVVKGARLPVTPGAGIGLEFSIQPPCSRQRMCIFGSARLHATGTPEAPAPMISPSTGSFMVVIP
jgi:hypothetical protein